MIASTSSPAHPECEGATWTVTDSDALAEICAEILIGRAAHAAEILAGGHPNQTQPKVSAALKAKLYEELHPASDARTWHRDGLLFEIICWVYARVGSTSAEAIADPHLKSTTQGTDCVKVSIDPAGRVLTSATICEYKCTTNWRRDFSEKVLAAFRTYISGERDNQLAQAVVSLLSGFGFNGPEKADAYERLISKRPFRFEASLTVEPGVFGPAKRLSLFKGFDEIASDCSERRGNTMPLEDVRAWFREFSAKVWARIEAYDVRP